MKKCKRPYDVKQALTNLPETLDDTYKRILLGIPKELAPLVARFLVWVAFSVGRISVEELAEAIIIEPDMEYPLDPDMRLTDPNEILTWCPNLVIVYSGRWDSNFELAHYSVKEYITSTRFKSDITLATFNKYYLGDPHEYLAKTCVCYWSLSDLDAQSINSPIKTNRTDHVWQVDLLQVYLVMQ